MPTILGSKWENFETKEKMSLAELFDKIKDAKYPCGAPQYGKHIFKDIIYFPPVQKRNQVWIDGKDGKFRIYNSTVMATLGEMASVAVDDAIWGKIDVPDTELSKKYGTMSNRWITYKLIDEIKDMIVKMDL